MRKKLYLIISSSEGSGSLNTIYNIFMVIAIVTSLVPLAFKQDHTVFYVLDMICVSIFIVDYCLRWLTADYKFKKHSTSSFICYPFSVMAIIDLISILPSLTILNQGFKLLRLLRLFRALRVVRAFKLFRFSKNAKIILNVFKRQKSALSYVIVLAVGYVIISALVIFNVEPDTFGSFFDAIYWATVSLTTVGYGDIYPVSDVGRLITMISSLFGIAIVALPAGIITAGYMEEIKDISENKQ